MKLKELESWLSQLKGFEKPKIQYEQYATDAHLASRLMYVAESTYNDIDGKAVLDLGCGCGMLSIAAILMGSAVTVSVDIDADALGIYQENMEQVFDADEVPCVELINADVTEFAPGRRFDTVVLNPPFGTKDKPGVDMVFLERALALASGAVYSMHKSSTREYIVRRAREQWGVRDVQAIAQMKFDLPATYRFHKKDRVTIDVDLLRFALAP